MFRSVVPVSVFTHAIVWLFPDRLEFEGDPWEVLAILGHNSMRDQRESCEFDLKNAVFPGSASAAKQVEFGVHTALNQRWLTPAQQLKHRDTMETRANQRAPQRNVTQHLNSLVK